MSNSSQLFLNDITDIFYPIIVVLFCIYLFYVYLNRNLVFILVKSLYIPSIYYVDCLIIIIYTKFANIL